MEHSRSPEAVTINKQNNKLNHKAVMKKTVTVMITRDEDCVRVTNNYGKSWEFTYAEDPRNDTSVAASLAAIASALLTGTIASHLKEVNNPKLTYELSVYY